MSSRRRRAGPLVAIALVLNGCCSPFYLGIEKPYVDWHWVPSCYAAAYDLGVLVQMWPIPFLFLFGVRAYGGPHSADRSQGRVGWDVAATFAMPVATVFMVAFGTLFLFPASLSVLLAPDREPPPDPPEATRPEPEATPAAPEAEPGPGPEPVEPGPHAPAVGPQATLPHGSPAGGR